jgi:hypothetical protein
MEDSYYSLVGNTTSDWYTIIIGLKLVDLCCPLLIPDVELGVDILAFLGEDARL